MDVDAHTTSNLKLLFDNKCVFINNYLKYLSSVLHLDHGKMLTFEPLIITKNHKS